MCAFAHWGEFGSSSSSDGNGMKNQYDKVFRTVEFLAGNFSVTVEKWCWLGAWRRCTTKRSEKNVDAKCLYIFHLFSTTHDQRPDMHSRADCALTLKWSEDEWLASLSMWRRNWHIKNAEANLLKSFTRTHMSRLVNFWGNEVSGRV